MIMETLRIDELHTKIITDITESGLNIGTIFFIVSTIKNEIEEYYLEQVQKEKAEMVQSQNKTEEEE